MEYRTIGLQSECHDKLHFPTLPHSKQLKLNNLTKYLKILVTERLVLYYVL